MVRVFDFDGTLVHSNESKRLAFLSLCQTDQERAYTLSLIEDRSLDRYRIAYYFCSQFMKSAEHFKLNLDTEINKAVHQSMVRQGAVETLTMLNEDAGLWHINSATPDDALKELVQFFFPFVTSRSLVIGSSLGKEESLIKIASSLGVPLHNVVFYGDGIDDLQASRETGCQFVPIAGGSLELSGYKLLYRKAISL